MTYKDFLVYLESNLDAYSVFMDKAIAYQHGKNANRPVAKRWSEEKMQRAAYEMWKTSMQNLYNQIKSNVKSNMPAVWTQYIEKNDVLSSVDEGIRDLNFSEMD